MRRCLPAFVLLLALGACRATGEGAAESASPIETPPTATERTSVPTAQAAQPTQAPTVEQGPGPEQGAAPTTPMTVGATAEAPPPDQGAIVLLECVGNVYDAVVRVDPASGQTESLASFDLSGAAIGDSIPGTTFGCEGPPTDSGWKPTSMAYRQQFDAAYERLAVRLDLLVCCTQHAGYIDRSGDLTDVTAMLAGTSYADASDHTFTLFEPATDYLTFLNYTSGVVEAVDLETGMLDDSRYRYGPQDGSGYVLDRFVLDPPTGIVVSAEWLPNPTTGAYVRDIPTSDALINGRGEEVVLPDGVACVRPLTWIGEDLLCQASNAQFALVQWEDGIPVAVETLLPPSSDRSNYSGVGSPEDDQLAFLSSQQSVVSLWIVDLEADAEPQRLAELPSDRAYYLLEWK